jgi:hypothetical protein
MVLVIVSARTAQKTSLSLLRVIVAGEAACSQNRSLARAIALSPVYAAVTWQFTVSQFQLHAEATLCIVFAVADEWVGT